MQIINYCLKAENARYKERYERWKHTAEVELQRGERLKAENAELRRALERYGRHKKNCASLLPVGIAVDEKRDCDCGLDKLREGANYDREM